MNNKPKSIALLICDGDCPAYQRPFGTYAEMITTFLRRIDAALVIDPFDATRGSYPTDLDTFDGFITTGSRASVYDPHPWIISLGALITTLHQQRRKLAAICFGHQLVAHVLGGKTEKAAQGWGVGVATSRIVRHTAWMHTAPDSINLIVSHQDQVTALPPEAELLATSDFCPVSMYRIGDHIFSMQGHPEFSKEYSSAVMQHHRPLFGEKTYQEGMASLTRPVDDELVGRWILAFLTGKTQGSVESRKD